MKAAKSTIYFVRFFLYLIANIILASTVIGTFGVFYFLHSAINGSLGSFIISIILFAVLVVVSISGSISVICFFLLTIGTDVRNFVIHIFNKFAHGFKFIIAGIKLISIDIYSLIEVYAPNKMHALSQIKFGFVKRFSFIMRIKSHIKIRKIIKPKKNKIVEEEILKYLQK